MTNKPAVAIVAIVPHLTELAVNLYLTTIRLLLCGILLVGSVPAWVHHASSCCGSGSLESSHASCGCCSQSPVATGTPKLGIASFTPPLGAHDCDQCAICLSLVTHNSKVQSVQFVLGKDFLNDQWVCHLGKANPSVRVYPTAQPRAPPACV